MPRESLSIQVPKTLGQKTLALAGKLEISNKELEIQKNAHFLYVPLTRQPSEEEMIILKDQLTGFQLKAHVFPERKPPEKTLPEILGNQLPPHLLAILPRALDIVGDIAIIQIPVELRTDEKIIGEAILKTRRNIRTVLTKIGAVSGTYRLPEFAFAAGEKRTNTVHKEYGCKYYVDLEKVYFSPRLSQEHRRVAVSVQEGETIVDLFAGAGPFSVLIAKKHENVKVYAVDINPKAIELLKRNIRLNRVENRVFPILGDAKQVTQDKLFGATDRVIMNLPEKAIEFVDAACATTKRAGGTVHFYGFVRLPDTLENVKLRFSQAVEKAGRRVDRFPIAKNIRETAPYEWQIVLDAKIL